MNKNFGFSKKDFSEREIDIDLFDEGVQHILDNYNFIKIQLVMKTLDIKFGGKILSINDMKEIVEDIAMKCLKFLSENEKENEIRIENFGFDFQMDRKCYMYLTYNIEDIYFE